MDSAAALRARRDRMANEWAGHTGPVLVASGLPLPISGSDQFHDFHAHAEHRYLSGASEPGSVLAFDDREGWTLFAPVASLEDRVWSGEGTPLEVLASANGLDRVLPAERLVGWLEARRGESVAVLGNHDLTHQPGAYGVPNWLALETTVDDEASERLSTIVAEARRTKDASEVATMRAAASATAAGHLAAMRLTRPGMTERQLQVEVEAEFYRNGSPRTAYGSIVGGGPNGAVLHFLPTNRPFADGEIVLMDAAAEVESYAADVTRVFPVGRRFEGIHRDLYALVLAVQEHAIAKARPGKEYKDLHLEASSQIAQGLVDLGILRGAADDLVERDAHALFFPHGLGHMLGLATHDSGGCLAGRPRSDRFGLKWLRADIPLAPGFVVTIEPGIYFIRALLTDAARREQYRDAVDWARVDTLLDIGGIRIEDDILITEDEPEVLSAAIPKQLAEVEALRREGLGS
ncbi:MAG: aminopeptidase P N-terminal domain-containing protein [Dehalococcoidia bacterium]